MHKLDLSKSGYVFVGALTLSLQKRDTDDDIRLRKHEYVDFTKWLNTFDMLVPRLKKSSIDTRSRRLLNNYFFSLWLFFVIWILKNMIYSEIMAWRKASLIIQRRVNFYFNISTA